LSATELNSFNSSALVSEFEGEQGDRFMTHDNDSVTFCRGRKRIGDGVFWYPLINSDYVAPYKAMMKMLGISIGMI